MTAAPRQAEAVVYRKRFARRSQRWRWRIVAANGRNIGNSGEGFADRVYAIASVTALLDGAYREADVRIVE